MNETKKLQEAKYFLTKMEETREDPNSFVYNLSAFLSAARSVLQYVFNETRKTANGNQWYQSFVKSSNTLKFFKDKRDVNIHKKTCFSTEQCSNKDYRFSPNFRIHFDSRQG
jgi:hypothetical protein